MTVQQDHPGTSHNLDAEAALLGGAMLAPEALEVLMTDVAPEDFYSPAHAEVFYAIKELWNAGIVKIDSVLVAEELQARKALDKIGGPGKLLEMQAGVPAIGSARHYARIVTHHAGVRRLARAGTQITDLALNNPGDLHELVDTAQTILSDIELPLVGGMPSESVDLFLEGKETYDWLIPGLLERRDRLIITGFEGYGKSTFLRQLAVCLAAGIHPFNYRPVPAVRVLYVDVENSAPQMRRKLKPMVDHVVRHPTWNPDNLLIERRGPVDVTSRLGAQWFHERIAANRPDVLITGPLYKLLPAKDRNTEEVANKAADFFDKMRERYDMALIIEAHSPQGTDGYRDLRPRGSAVWMGWPEFGYGLRPNVEAGYNNKIPNEVWFESWRGDRDEREWPARLVSDGAKFWPWRDPDAPVGREPTEGARKARPMAGAREAFRGALRGSGGDPGDFDRNRGFSDEVF